MKPLYYKPYHSVVFYFIRRTLKQSIENSNVKNRLAECQKANEALKRMLSHMPTVEVKHKLVVQQVSLVLCFCVKDIVQS